MSSTASMLVGLTLLGVCSQSLGGKVNSIRVGCFRDKQLPSLNRPLPKLIKNYRVPPEVMDWKDLNGSVVERCAEEANMRNYAYFAVQYWGECWSGPRAHLTYDRDGKSENCYNDTVGKAFTNMVYRITGPDQECLNYRTLNAADRSALIPLPTGTPPKCDHYAFGFQPGWYRFDGAAGTKMRDTCVPKRHCGAHMTGWLCDPHPAVTDGTVPRRVCFSDTPGLETSCCQKEVQIRARNCGRFFVYDLPSAPGCRLRYCGNGTQATNLP